MGLDMYLYAKRYLSEYGDEEEKALQEEVSNIVQHKMPGRVCYITTEVLYWRKANAIHNWFVKNVQDDEDDCREYYVPIDKLKELRDTLSEILANKDKVEELLPTIHGFFFGSADYDQWYFDEIQRTESVLTDVINSVVDNDYGLSFYYQSSW